MQLLLCVEFYAEDPSLFAKLNTEQKLHVFRIVQESVNNALKHSKASEISVILREESGAKNPGQRRLLFLVSDDGIGISEQKAPDDVISQNTHLGLKGMKSRAELLGAKLEIKSDKETGTQIKLYLPAE